MDEKKERELRARIAPSSTQKRDLHITRRISKGMERQKKEKSDMLL